MRLSKLCTPTINDSDYPIVYSMVLRLREQVFV